MGIKVFRIVLDGVVHEVEVEEIHRESRGGGQNSPGKDCRCRRRRNTEYAASGNGGSGFTESAGGRSWGGAVQKGAFCRHRKDHCSSSGDNPVGSCDFRADGKMRRSAGNHRSYEDGERDHCPARLHGNIHNYLKRKAAVAAGDPLIEIS